MAAPVYYHRLKHVTRIPTGFTDSNTVTTTQAKVRKGVHLNSGLTVNEDCTDAAAVTVTPGAGG